MKNTFGNSLHVTLWGESHGESIGAVVLLSREPAARMGDTELKVAETTASIVGRQMEQ